MTKGDEIKLGYEDAYHVSTLWKHSHVDETRAALNRTRNNGHPQFVGLNLSQELRWFNGKSKISDSYQFEKLILDNNGIHFGNGLCSYERLGRRIASLNSSFLFIH